MADLFPTDPKRIRERIRRYERALKRELEAGYGGDGYGKRFLLGPLYMLMGDVDGALASFDWYEGAYPDDTVGPRSFGAPSRGRKDSALCRHPSGIEKRTTRAKATCLGG